MKIMSSFVWLLSIVLTSCAFPALASSKLIRLRPGKIGVRMTATNSHISTASAESPQISIKTVGSWPCGDELDKKIFNLALPALLNFAIVPLVGAADTFWVGRMRNALALAGQGAANQVFNSAFFVMSFLPSVMTPMIARAHGAGDQLAMQQQVGQAFLIGSITGLIGTAALTLASKRALNPVLAVGAPARMFAEPYLAIRGVTFIAALLSTVSFAAFRGTLNLVTPLKISVFSNLVNVILDPLLMFTFKLGVPGAAMATCAAEITGLLLYIRALSKRQMLNMRSVLTFPSRTALMPLLIGGASVQLRSIAINMCLLAVTSTVQRLDNTGTTAAAHAIALQLFQLGSVGSMALSVVAGVIIPSIRTQSLKENNSILPAKQAANRIMVWGVIIGVSIGVLQALALPLLSVFSPLKEVQQAARVPALIGAVLQALNCIVWTGEGIQQGNEDLPSLAASTVLGTAAMLLALRSFGNSLVGVWASFGLLGIFRLLGTLRHHFFSGPLAQRPSAA